MIVRWWRRSPWIWPILLGLPTALLVGVSSALPTLRDHAYLTFHCYTTASALLTAHIGERAGAIVGVLYLALAAGWIGSRFPGHVGRTLRIILPLLVLASVPTYLLATRPDSVSLLKVMALTAARAAGHWLVEPVGLSALLALLIAALVLHRQTRHLASVFRWVTRGGRVILGALIVMLSLLSLTCLTIGAAAGILRLRADLRLRDKPNIIFIMVDTLRADHVGCYGGDLPLTPRIDAFARESTRYEHAVAQSSWTIWSVHSLMTSRFPDRLLPDRPGYEMDAGASPLPYYPALAKILHEQGYSTNAVISNPLLRNMTGSSSPGYDYYDVGPALLNVDCNETSPHVNTAALQRLSEIKQRKFFLYLVYMDPHDPYHHNQGYDYPDSARDAATRRVIAASSTPQLLRKRQEDLRHYHSEIGYTDHYVGEFLDALRREGLYDSSLIVLFSDHGEEFLEHGRFGHEVTVYEEVIDVPLLVKLPYQRAGTIVRGTYPLIDLYPSLLQYLRIDGSALGLQGDAVAFADVMRSVEKPWYSSTIGGVRSVRNGRFKYIRTDASIPLPTVDGRTPPALPSPTLELYDLTADPLEQTNIIRAQPALADQMAALLNSRDARALPTDPKASAGRLPPVPLNADQIERLKALGYLGE